MKFIKGTYYNAYNNKIKRQNKFLFDIICINKYSVDYVELNNLYLEDTFLYYLILEQFGFCSISFMRRFRL
jgi:hypothetical protein